MLIIGLSVKLNSLLPYLDLYSRKVSDHSSMVGLMKPKALVTTLFVFDNTKILI